jgi:hypothetical protein
LNCREVKGFGLPCGLMALQGRRRKLFACHRLRGPRCYALGQTIVADMLLHVASHRKYIVVTCGASGAAARFERAIVAEHFDQEEAGWKDSRCASASAGATRAAGNGSTV